MRSVEIGKRLPDSTRLGYCEPKPQIKSRVLRQERDQKTLEQKLFNDLTTGCSDCRVDGEFAGSGSASRGKQIGEIGASDQQNEADRSKQQPEIRAVLADEIIE